MSRRVEKSIDSHMLNVKIKVVSWLIFLSIRWNKWFLVSHFQFWFFFLSPTFWNMVCLTVHFLFRNASMPTMFIQILLDFHLECVAFDEWRWIKRSNDLSTAIYSSLIYSCRFYVLLFSFFYSLKLIKDLQSGFQHEWLRSQYITDYFICIVATEKFFFFCQIMMIVRVAKEKLYTFFVCFAGVTVNARFPL